MIRNRLRAWLGIGLAQERADLAFARVVELEQSFANIQKLASELRAALQQVNEVREMIQDPKRAPIKTRSFQQFRNLMEAE